MKSKLFSLLAISIALVSCSDSDDAPENPDVPGDTPSVEVQKIKEISLSNTETQMLKG